MSRSVNVVLVLVLALSGCCATTEKVERLVNVAAQAEDVTLGEWNTLSDGQKRSAAEKSRDAYYTLRLRLFGTPLPEDLVR